MATLGTKSSSKVAQNFYCYKCDYITCKKSNYVKHILTIKHQGTNGDKCPLEQDTKVAYVCDVCEKKYLSRNGLWVHKKTCNQKKNIIMDDLSDKNLIVMLINDNKEMRNLLIEQSKEKTEFNTMIIDAIKNVTTSNTTNNNYMNNNNNNNKTFNLQFFLNETCIDAMNMSEFIETIKIQLSDLEKMGEIGYVQGLSNIINNNLKTLDITQRPVHCTDQKRETIYIKNDNIWEKEDDNKTKLRKAINKISFKNIKVLPQFREKYPDYHNSSLKISGVYDKLVLEAMGGSGNNDFQKETKIIHNISKCIIIDSKGGGSKIHLNNILN